MGTGRGPRVGWTPWLGPFPEWQGRDEGIPGEWLPRGLCSPEAARPLCSSDTHEGLCDGVDRDRVMGQGDGDQRTDGRDWGYRELGVFSLTTYITSA